MLTIAIAIARPQYSILQNFGTKCIGCHYNTQGGGARTQPGWMARKDISLINPSSIGLQDFYDMMSSNSALDESIMFGTDFRWQYAKWPPPIGRDMMVMQFSPYLIIQPFGWLGFEGFYNIAYDIAYDKRFVGQNPYSVSMYIKPSEKLPSLRVGYFQPTIGTKYDDHTMLIREVTGFSRSGGGFDPKFSKPPTKPLIPDDYAEFGAQIDYEALDWLGLSVGAFDTKNMIKLTTKNKTNTTISVVDTGSVSMVLRAFVTPPTLIDGITTFLGGTYLLNGDYYISSAFLNIGLTEKLCLITEYVRSEKKDSRLTQNVLAEVTYAVTDAVLPFIRAERGQTKYKNENHPFYTNQFVFGAHINILPYIDLLPEYRIYNSEQVPGYNAEWTFQVHIFY